MKSKMNSVSKCDQEWPTRKREKESNQISVDSCQAQVIWILFLHDESGELKGKREESQRPESYSQTCKEMMLMER